MLLMASDQVVLLLCARADGELGDRGVVVEWAQRWGSGVDQTHAGFFFLCPGPDFVESRVALKIPGLPQQGAPKAA